MEADLSGVRGQLFGSVSYANVIEAETGDLESCPAENQPEVASQQLAG